VEEREREREAGERNREREGERGTELRQGVFLISFPLQPLPRMLKATMKTRCRLQTDLVQLPDKSDKDKDKAGGGPSSPRKPQIDISEGAVVWVLDRTSPQWVVVEYQAFKGRVPADAIEIMPPRVRGRDTERHRERQHSEERHRRRRDRDRNREETLLNTSSGPTLSSWRRYWWGTCPRRLWYSSSS